MKLLVREAMNKNLIKVLATGVIAVGVATASLAQVTDPRPPISTPDATATIILLGAAVIGLGVLGRRLA